MTLQEFGAYLTEKRQSRSLSIHDIASSLKLSSRVVQAMEDVNLGDLPHAAYVRAFYFSYATALDIDNELVHTALEELVVESTEDSSMTRMPIKQSRRRLGALLLLFVFVVALFAIVYAIMSSSMFSDLSSMTSKPKTHQSEQVFSSDIALAEKPLVASSMPGTKTATAPSTETVNPAGTSEVSVSANVTSNLSGLPATAQTTAEAASNSLALSSQKVDGVLADTKQTPLAAIDGEKTVKLATGTTITPIVTAMQEVNPAPTTPAPTLAEPDRPVGTTYFKMDNGTRHTLVLAGLNDSWLRVTVGETVRQFSMKKGQILTVRFDNTAILRLGNAGGISATFDGKKLPSLGVAGEVRTLTFPNS